MLIQELTIQIGTSVPLNKKAFLTANHAISNF